MCTFGHGSKSSERNMAIWQAQRDEEMRQQAERERLEAQAAMERRLEEQRQREAAIVAEQQRVAAAAAEQARADEARRQQMIVGNRGAVDTAFAGFNDDYFNNAASRFTAANLPAFEDDYRQSLDRLKAALAGRGVLESSVGVNQIADLDRKAATERATIASKGMDFANSLREKVGAARNTLYDAASSAAEPQGFAARATGEATNLVNLGGVVPFGRTNAYGTSTPGSGVAAPANNSVFGSILAPLVNAANANLNAPRATKSIAEAMAAPTTGSGTSKVRG